MNLFNTLRKAGSLLVELPPEAASVDINQLRSDDITTDDIPLPENARLSYDMDAPRGDRPAAKSVADIARETNGPDLDKVQVDGAALPATDANTPLDFAAVYRAAKLPEENFGAEQMIEMLVSLPAELPLDTKRATVRAMLGTLGKTTGATPETLVADASRKLAALNSFAQFMEKKTTDSIAQNEQTIAELQAQIEEKRTAILNARNGLTRVMKDCELESDRLDDVLEFFSLDQGASKYAGEATQ
ncbi:hypothetical protein IAD21_06244 [Abditibacteriota bacterium]|nr:hypothetical protein IAD21_06244 [Abditibacteriota bacterium]